MPLRRGDVTVISISAGLAAVVVAAVVFSLFVTDRSNGFSADEPGASSSSLLVVTWGPSLCKVESSNPGCKSGHVGKLGRKMILHGLWPQPPSEQFCGVPKGVADRVRDLHGADMPSLSLPADVQANLQSMMSDAESLVPHEWYTHGTCAGLPPATYFTDAMTLADQAGKILNPLFEKAQGGDLTLRAVRDRFNAEFGAGAGDHVAMTCRDVAGEEILLYEVHVSLPPVSRFVAPENTVSLGDLLVKGPTISAGCRRGSVP